MKKFDLYIIRKYLATFFFAVLMITAIAVVMNLSEYIDRFISNDLSVSQVAFDYYLYFIPWINGELWPLFAFLSVIFFTSRLARDSEIIAMLSTGMSYTRILQPMVIAGCIIAIVHWIGENYVIPHSTFYKTEFESKYIKRNLKTVLANDVQFFISPHQKIYCSYFAQRDSSLDKFRLERFDSTGALKSIMKSQKLIYVNELKKWRAKNYEIRNFVDGKEELLIGKGEELDTTLAMVPSDFIKHSKQMEIMITPALRDFIKRENSKGLDNTKSYQIEAYKRTSAPFTIIILTLIGACIGTRKVRGGLGIHLAIGVSIGAAFTVISKFSETFANNLSFAPLLGVWVPNILFGLLSYYLLTIAQK